jgi:ADP-ribose pyrophosphatase
LPTSFEPEPADAKILERIEDRLSSWVRVVGKRVDFGLGGPAETYHCLGQPDYVAILARTRSGLIPLVRQYRPAVEAYTWELPSGLLEGDETPEAGCRRELREETGLHIESVVCLGCFYPDTGRLENQLHAFYVEASEPDPGFVPELGLAIEFVTPKALRQQILSGKFRHQLHLALFAIAWLRGHLTLT